MTLEQLINEVTAKILSGGKRTTAVNVRALLTDILESYPNNDDGGLVVNTLLGYSNDLTPIDNKHFATKKYVDDSISSGDVLHQGTNPLTEPLAFIGDKVGIGTDTSLDASLTIFSDDNKGLKIRSQTLDRFNLYSDSVTEDIIMNSINATFFMRRSGSNVLSFSDTNAIVYKPFYAGDINNMGIFIDNGNQGNRFQLFTSDGTGGLNDDENYMASLNSSLHILGGAALAKSWDFLEDGDFSINNGNLLLNHNAAILKGDGTADGDIQIIYGLDPDTSQPAILFQKIVSSAWTTSSYIIM